MKTHLDCIPCFFRQALEAARFAGADEISQKEIVDEIGRLMTEFSLESSPPEIGRIVYEVVKNKTGRFDPFKEIKKKSNEFVLGFLPELKNKIQGAENRLLAAVKLSILGNIIDYGANNYLDIKKEMDRIITFDFDFYNQERGAIFGYREFENALKGVRSVLYLADNAGEVVFDRLLIEELNKLNKEVIYVVRDKPIINDALMEDAKACGIDKYAHIISSGVDTPGVILDFCSNDFLKIYQEAKLIISKGQGNFEALSEENKPIFFLFKVKCPIVARYIACEVGESILKPQVREKNNRVFAS